MSREKTSSFRKAGIEIKFPLNLHDFKSPVLCSGVLGRGGMYKFLWIVLTYGDCLQKRGLDGRIILILILKE
jgi:hypothetical protein